MLVPVLPNTRKGTGTFIKSAMTTLIRVRRIISRRHGEEVYSPPRDMMVQYIARTKLIGRFEGTQEANRSSIISLDEIITTDRIWLPGDDPTNLDFFYTPKNIAAFPDPFGRCADSGMNLIHHWEMNLSPARS